MKLYNTLSKKKEEFVPIEEGKVRMYVCGPTVYNYIHIGNARPMIVFDTVRRYFEYKGYEVNYVSNFTDVDDKIINKSIEEGISASEVSERYIQECKKDMADLNIKPATKNPKATEEIDGMINEKSKGWSTDRMGKVDLTIIRLAVYEMKYDDTIPEGVAINEAVELAKKFGQDESAGFINGVLAKFVEKAE